MQCKRRAKKSCFKGPILCISKTYVSNGCPCLWQQGRHFWRKLWLVSSGVRAGGFLRLTGERYRSACCAPSPVMKVTRHSASSGAGVKGQLRVCCDTELEYISLCAIRNIPVEKQPPPPPPPHSPLSLSLHLSFFPSFFLSFPLSLSSLCHHRSSQQTDNADIQRSAFHLPPQKQCLRLAGVPA